MAVVGEAYILVRAITTEIKKDIANGFEGVKGQSTKEGSAAGQAFGQGFGNKMRDEATEAARGFHKLMRRGYAVQGGIGAAATSVSALIGGLIALSGALAGAAASGIAFVGVMAQMKVAGAVGKLAFKGVLEAAKDTGSQGTKSLRELREEMQQLAFAAEEAALGEQDAALKLERARETLARVQDLPPNNRARREAELAYSQAELAFRKAKDKNNDAQEELTNPKKKKKEGKDPYKDLSESQIKFVKYLKGLDAPMKKMREAAAGGFLPVIQEQMEELFSKGYFEEFNAGIADVSQGLGNATARFAGSIFDAGNRENLRDFFKSTGVTVGKLGGVVGNFFGVFLRVMKAANPLIQTFTGFLDRKSTALGESSKKNFVQLQTFFNNAGKAAGVLGRILSNIFQPVKRLLMDQVKPGSAGMEFLNWIKKSTEGMRELRVGADGLSLNDKLKPAVENTKAMFQAFSGLGSMILALGANPGVKQFWETLANGSGALEKIMNTMASTTGPALANVIVRLLEIVAAFADSGQIKAYFDVLATILQVFSVLAGAIGGLMQILGPATGALGAFITSWLLLRKAMMIAYGSWGILRGAIISVIAVQQRKIIADKVQIALEAKYLVLSNRKKTAMALEAVQLKKQVVGTNAKTLATFRDNIASNANISATKKKNYLAALDAALSKRGATATQMKTIATMQGTMAQNVNVQSIWKKTAADTASAAASGTSAGAMVAQGAAAAGATAPVTIFGIALNAALWPIVLIAGTVALAIAGIALLIGHHNDKVRDAQNTAVKAMKNTATAGAAMNMQIARSQEVWTASLASSSEVNKSAVSDVTKLSKVNNKLIDDQKNGTSTWKAWGAGALFALSAIPIAGAGFAMLGLAVYDSDSDLRAYKEGLKNTGAALAKIAKKDLKAAQQEFIKFANASNLGRDELIAQMKEMPEFQEQLAKTAEKYGLVTDAMSEEEKQAVYTDIALNRGAYAAAKAAEAQQQLALKIKDAANSFIDLQSPLEQATVKGKIDLDKYNAMVRKQYEDQAKWMQNMAALQAMGLSDAAREHLIGMGKDGASYVAALKKGGQDAVNEFNSVVGEGALKQDVMTALLADKTPLFAVLGKKLGGSMADTIRGQLERGETDINKVMETYGVSAADINAYMQTMPNPVIEQDVGWNQDSITKAQKDLASKLKGSYKISIDASQLADGGLAGSVRGFANGGLLGFANGGNVMKRFAPGGQVFGQGGPRSDKIPAMLSNGEYVVNAAATARALPLLNALNYGVTQANGPAGTLIGGGGPSSLMSSVQIIVNPSPGMSETEIAAAVSRELSFQMRRGSA